MYKERLKRLILTKGFLYSPEPKFKLSHTEDLSQYYFDCRPVVLDPYGINLISEMIYKRIYTSNLDSIGGPELGAVPIVSAIVHLSYQKFEPVRGFIIRKKAKDYGTKNKIEGQLREGDRVAILEDVITTGSSVVDAIKKVHEAGAKVSKVIGIVDRQENNAMNIIRNYCIDVETLITRTELMELYNGYSRDNKK